MGRRISWVLVVLWMALIFYFSSQVATESNNLSTGLTIIFKNIINNIFSGFDFSTEALNHFFRKVAHFSIYFILGILLKNALRYENFSFIKSNVYSIMAGVLYAISDEFHQSFVPNRGPQVSDIMIDSIGVVFGVLLMSYIIRRNRKSIASKTIANIKDRLQL